MRKMFIGLLVTLTLMSCSEQLYQSTTKFGVSDLYKSKSDNLLNDTVFTFDGLSQSQIKTNFKNFAGAKFFVSDKNALESETENQLVYVYITNKFYAKVMGGKTILPWYIRLVVQFKDNKIKLSFYDDGNVFRPAERIGTTYNYTPAVPSRTSYFYNYFKLNTDEPTIYTRESLIGMKYNIITTMSEIYSGVTKPIVW